MNHTSPPDLVKIVQGITGIISRPTESQRRLIEQLKHHASRLSKSAFQLAVLGQFKRGKSSLLNALVGYPLLSTGILPLTAVPTFLSQSENITLNLKYTAGGIDQPNIDNLQELASAIAAATTEELNPHNAKGIERVEAAMPSSQWLFEVTLIDTPGVGSTYNHNTETAHGILPECDAALFVLSVDPPITELEVSYLKKICRNVSHVIIVLNKIDLVDPADQHKAIEFLASVLAREAKPQLDQRIFAVSARLALAARMSDDREKLLQSGLPELEDHLRRSLVDKKRVLLESSIVKKISEIVAALEADAGLTVQALTIPLSDLDKRIGLFEKAAIDITRERENLHDLLSGEWRRTLGKLDSFCEEAERRIRLELKNIVGNFYGSESDRTDVQSKMFSIFDREFESIGTLVDAEVAAAVSTHQQRYLTLVRSVREAAGTLMDVAVSGVASDDWLEIKREPYWIEQARLENLSSITVDVFARLLPARMRRKRQQRKVRDAIEGAITRNISDLRWSMRQNIDDSFRRLLFVSKEVVDRSVASTREVLEAARERRRSESESIQHETEYADRVLQQLRRLRTQLELVSRVN